MRKTAHLLLVVVALAFAPGRADNIIENSDFATGIDHWYGGGRSPADFANDNPLGGSDPFLSKGLIIPLKHMDWTHVAQDFKGKIASGTLTITYKISPDFAFSTKADDYVGIPAHIRYDLWQPFNTEPGTWMCLLSDFGGTPHGTYIQIKPKPGSSDVQTMRTRVSGLTPLENKTITLAFPPGTGTLVVLSVTLDNSPTE